MKSDWEDAESSPGDRHLAADHFRPSGPEEFGEEAIRCVEQLCAKYDISALDVFIESVRTFSKDRILNAAVLGRFKAGKSSFLNHLLGRALLPVGAIPVTSVVTEMEYGPEERAEIRFRDGHAEIVPVEAISEFISELENPGNSKDVESVRVKLPSMRNYREIRLVDTPGLESVLEHNTGASLDWLPHVGVALVAVGVDPPLSRHDIELIKSLRRYTPNVEILLTKVDLLNEPELDQVMEFVCGQLSKHWDGEVKVFPVSVRPGYERFLRDVDASLLQRVRTGALAGAESTLRHKLDSLLEECRGYLAVALKAAESADSERADLRAKILGQKGALDDVRLALRLISRHAAASLRPTYEAILRPVEPVIRQKLLQRMRTNFPEWAKSLSGAIGGFEDWLGEQLAQEMAALSEAHASEFLESVRRAGRQLSQSLQDYRNRVSLSALKALGVPLQTKEIDLTFAAPRSPDIRVGKIFDHNWELISWLVPMPLVRGAVLHHFERKAGDVLTANLSRLVTQWEELASDSLHVVEKESAQRLDRFVSTVESLIGRTRERAPMILKDLERIDELRARLADEEPV